MDPMSEVFLCLSGVVVIAITALYVYERIVGPTYLRDIFWSREEQAKRLRPRG
jgi:p-aminobenzoyl-glutamate transporter AbgT